MNEFSNSKILVKTEYFVQQLRCGKVLARKIVIEKKKKKKGLSAYHKRKRGHILNVIEQGKKHIQLREKPKLS